MNVPSSSKSTIACTLPVSPLSVICPLVLRKLRLVLLRKALLNVMSRFVSEMFVAFGRFVVGMMRMLQSVISNIVFVRLLSVLGSANSHVVFVLSNVLLNVLFELSNRLMFANVLYDAVLFVKVLFELVLRKNPYSVLLSAVLFMKKLSFVVRLMPVV